MKRALAIAAIFLASCAAMGPPGPLKVTVTDIALDYFTAPDARFTVQVKLANPNAEEVAVDAMTAELRLEDIAVGSASLAAPVRVPARGEVTASVVAAPDLVSSLKASAQIANRLRTERQSNPAVRYAIVGTVTLQNGVVIPFSRAGDFKLGVTAPAR